VPSTNATAFYADGQEYMKSEDEEDDSDADVPDMAVAVPDTMGNATATNKKISKWIVGYTPK
jgi:hypothetical protein